MTFTKGDNFRYNNVFESFKEVFPEYVLEDHCLEELYNPKASGNIPEIVLINLIDTVSDTCEASFRASRYPNGVIGWMKRSEKSHLWESVSELEASFMWSYPEHCDGFSLADVKERLRYCLCEAKLYQYDSITYKRLTFSGIVHHFVCGFALNGEICSWELYCPIKVKYYLKKVMMDGLSDFAKEFLKDYPQYYQYISTFKYVRSIFDIRSLLNIKEKILDCNVFSIEVSPEGEIEYWVKIDEYIQDTIETRWTILTRDLVSTLTSNLKSLLQDTINEKKKEFNKIKSEIKACEMFPDDEFDKILNDFSIN